MSVEYFMVSDKEAIWVAQVGFSGFTFYSGEKLCMKAYRDFLERNMGQTLRFLDSNTVDDLIEGGKIIEIEWQS